MKRSLLLIKVFINGGHQTKSKHIQITLIMVTTVIFVYILVDPLGVQAKKVRMEGEREVALIVLCFRVP